MSASDSVDHEKTAFTHENGTAGLSRQVTLQLNAEQYERLFFQPSAAKGDLSKRLGNPTLLGLMGFLIPFSATMFCLLDFQGSTALSLTSVSGAYYYIGGIAMIIAGIAEFILGNSFPMTVFVIFGTHWAYLGYTMDPSHMIQDHYGAAGAGALNQTFNAGQGNYNAVMAIVCFIFFCGSLRTNVPFVVVFLCLIFIFSFFSAGYYSLGYNPTAAGFDHAVYYFKIAGGFGFVAMIMGWYLALITACASTGVPCPLPIFDLSHIGAHNKQGQTSEHARVVQTVQ